VIVDGATMSITEPLFFDPTVQAPGDRCPEFFWLQIDNPAQVFARGGRLFARAEPVAPATAENCATGFELSIAPDTGTGFAVTEVIASDGQWSCIFNSCVCQNLPQRLFSEAEVALTPALRVGMPSGDAAKRLTITAVAITPT
jgi:hypothetical protein